jgi:glycosyltransferase involved in cell wall biosynthesis
MKETPISRTGSQPRHILFVIDALLGWGGAEGALLRITRGLAASGIRCSVITFSAGPEKIMKAFPCPVHHMPIRFRYGLGALAAVRRIRRYIREEGVDILHTFFAASDLLGGMAGVLGGCKVMISSRRDMGILRKPGQDLSYRLANRFFDQIQAVSERVRGYVIEHDRVDPAKVVTVYNGVDLADWTPADPAPAPENIGPAPRIVSVGHMRTVKGYDVLLRAAALVIKSFPAAQFIILGDENERDISSNLHNLAETLGITSNVRFLGLTSNVAGILRHCQVYCLLSRSEGMSNALIEAMAAGLPPVVTSVGGNPEVVEHGRSGFLVDSEDHEGAARSILDLLGNPELRSEMGRRAQSVVEQRFSSERMITTMLNNYQTLLDRRSRRSFLEGTAY